MKKRPLLLIIFLVLGLLAGSLVSKLLSPYPAVGVLTRSTDISWHPQADLDFLKYDFYFQVKLSLLSLLGMIAAIWMYRKV